MNKWTNRILVFLILMIFSFPFVNRVTPSEGFTLPAIDNFIYKWENSGGSELASSQLFITDLCILLDLPVPNPPRAELHDNTYVFEKSIEKVNSTGRRSRVRVDLYKKGHFIWESKQGTFKPADTSVPQSRGTARRETVAWDKAILDARIQAVDYAHLLPKNEHLPPFILVADIGYTIDIYADFRGTGDYLPYPSASTNRITLEDIRKPAVQELLRTIWTDPLSLDSSRESEKVTREVAFQLFELAESFEDKGYSSDEISVFIQRCIFVMFAEDSYLLPSNLFMELLTDFENRPEKLAPALNELWETMQTGEIFNIQSSILDNAESLQNKDLLQFQGSILENAKALPMDKNQIAILLEASQANWASVDTSIFGALLEYALSPRERSKLGAHYTPTSYVERLVIPTIIEPERELWSSAKDRALDFVLQGNQESAINEIEKYYKHLSEIIILDPSCGSGNFLAVSLVLLKEIESEVVEALKALGLSDIEVKNIGYSVLPQQFRGIEVVQRASDISDLVLWISYFQQHFKIHGNATPAEPIPLDFNSVECRDAVLAWDSIDIHENGTVTYINPRPADSWGKATYIVGNPPYIGKARMREALSNEYVEALRGVYPELPQNIDYVMYWWHRAAILAKTGEIERFGFITTSTINQTFNRQVVEQHINPQSDLNILFAIPNHPWYDVRLSGASVRIAMTVCGLEQKEGVLAEVILERPDGDYIKVNFDKFIGTINTNLTIGLDTTQAIALKANDDICINGVMPLGKGFIITLEQAKDLGLGTVKGLENHIKPYMNGSDVVRKSRNFMIIDLYALSLEEVEQQFLLVYGWIVDNVKAERLTKNRASHREKWWLFAETRSGFRKASKGLERYIVVPQVSKHGIFVFLDKEILPDNALVTIASDDAYILGVLSSKVHKNWAIATGAKRGSNQNSLVYTKTTCFDMFPFPNAEEEQKAEIREIAEQIDKHRKDRQAQHSDLILTDMYNVMDLMFYGVHLSDKEELIKEQGDLMTLYNLHNDLDIAVAKAYDWTLELPENPPFVPDYLISDLPIPLSDYLSDDEILFNLLELNTRRALEEEQGKIRYLRPEYQKELYEGSISLLEYGKEGVNDDDFVSQIIINQKPVNQNTFMQA